MALKSIKMKYIQCSTQFRIQTDILDDSIQIYRKFKFITLSYVLGSLERQINDCGYREKSVEIWRIKFFILEDVKHYDLIVSLNTLYLRHFHNKYSVVIY